MKINVVLPFDNLNAGDEFMSLEAIKSIAPFIERLGFNGVNVTDHPCPSAKWLDNGGHYAQDPFVVLSMVAACTQQLKLCTGILVLPYRNPFITARTIASLDYLSNGRLMMGFGAGYMKGEYYALGADFDARNDTMDEYLQALKLALSEEDFSFKGTGYEARNCRILPTSKQRPHPPFLVGGNSPRAMRRAAELADAWYPFFTAPVVSATARTAQINSITDLAKAKQYLLNHCEKINRQTPPFIMTGSIKAPGEQLSHAQYLDKIGQLADLGVSVTCYAPQGDTRQAWCDDLQQFVEEVLNKLPKEKTP